MATQDVVAAALKRAIELDEQGRSKEAIKHYVSACELALRALKNEKDTQARIKLVSRLQGWLERAEQLKKVSAVQGLPDAPSPEKESSRADPLEGVVGLEHVKEGLREAIILPSTQPQIFVGERKPWKAILLYGPPGTGKSLLASTLAKEADCSFFAISSSDIVSKYLGESEQAIRSLFKKARDSVAGHPTKRAVIFIDEIDAIGQTRGASSNEKESDVRLLTELLRQMDGVGTDNSQVVVIGATNLPQNLDSALRRRFERRLFVPLPGVVARAQILAKHIGPPGEEHALTPQQVALVARRLKGYSGADIASFANELLLRPVRKCLGATHFARTATGKLVPCPSTVRFAQPMRMLDKSFEAQSLEVPLATLEDANDVLMKSKPSISPNDFVELEAFEKQYGERGEEEKTEEEEKVPYQQIVQAVERQWGHAMVESVGEAVTKVFGAISSTINGMWKKTLVPS